jgi:PhnB protein
MHAEIEIGGCVIMLADEFPQMGAVSPQTLGGSPVFVHLYVPDAHPMFAKAVAAGTKSEQPMENKFYGDRWTLSAHVEDVTPEEIGRRMAAMMKSS